MTRRRITILIGLLVLAALIFTLRTRDGSANVPFVPAHDGAVLERLPMGRSDPRARELETLRRKLAASPGDLALATFLARRDIEESRARSDPRYLGYAQAALAPWWTLDAPPPEVLVLRATIRQSTHDFDGALRDLDAVLRAAPNDPQAWITRSVVLTVRGEYDAAKASCGPLAHLTSNLVVAVCLGSVEAVTGEARVAYTRIETALKSGQWSAGEEAWAVSTLGEIAVRLGDAATAERNFARALAIDPSDAYATAALCDLLLDLGRPNEVAARLASSESNDGLLLRLALAETAAGMPSAKGHVALLAARFEASHARGDTVHRREESRYALHLARDAQAALTLARANWDVQKEPWDVRIYLEAALAAHDPEAARPILAWLDRTHLEDPKIADAASKLRAPH